MGHVQRRARTRADGTEVVQYVARWREPSGRERSRTWTRKRDAERWLRQVDAERAEGRDVMASRRAAATTVGDYLEQWVATTVRARLDLGKLRPRSASTIAGVVRRHLVPRLGDLALGELAPSHVEDLLLAGMTRDGYAAGTVHKARTTLSKALGDAVRDRLLPTNVARDVDAPPLPNPEPSTFTDDELRRLVAEWSGEGQVGALFGLALLAGLRASELVALRWDDVDLESGTLVVSRTRHVVTAAPELGIAAGTVEGPPKSNASGRRVPLSADAVELLRQHRAGQAAARLASSTWIDGGYVFTTGVGTALSTANVRRTFARVGERAGVDVSGRKLHELRRTWTTRLRDAGVPLEDLVALGRWSSPTVLLRHYAGTPEDRLRAAANASRLDAN